MAILIVNRTKNVQALNTSMCTLSSVCAEGLHFLVWGLCCVQIYFFAWYAVALVKKKKKKKKEKPPVLHGCMPCVDREV